MMEMIAIRPGLTLTVRKTGMQRIAFDFYGVDDDDRPTVLSFDADLKIPDSGNRSGTAWKLFDILRVELGVEDTAKEPEPAP